MCVVNDSQVSFYIYFTFEGSIERDHLLFKHAESGVLVYLRYLNPSNLT